MISPTLLENLKVGQSNDFEICEVWCRMTEGEMVEKHTYSDGMFHFHGKITIPTEIFLR